MWGRQPRRQVHGGRPRPMRVKAKIPAFHRLMQTGGFSLSGRYGNERDQKAFRPPPCISAGFPLREHDHAGAPEGVTAVILSGAITARQQA